jgi:hypothetical protein
LELAKELYYGDRIGIDDESQWTHWWQFNITHVK